MDIQNRNNPIYNSTKNKKHLEINLTKYSKRPIP